MYGVTISLILLVVFMALLDYLKVLYDSKRKITIVEREVDADGNKKKKLVVKEYPQAPGPPYVWPILGNMVDMGKYPLPTIAFNELSKKYGDIYSMTLGSTKCVIISGLDLILEILNRYGNSIDGRPNFIRFHQLFDGNRDDSLALCDWSELHKKRRFFSRKYCAPVENTRAYNRMGEIGRTEMDELLRRIALNTTPGKDFYIKPLISQACFNIFTQYMCSVQFEYDEPDFQKIVHIYDKIIWEVNEGNIIDFIPWMRPLYEKHLKTLDLWSKEIREFIVNRIIEPYNKTEIRPHEMDKDFTEYLFKTVANEPEASGNTVLFMLEDFLGGHSALANFVTQVLGYIALHPETGERIQKEIDRVTLNGTRKVQYNDDNVMPYTMSTIYESLRYTSSPIVPHVATEDIAIAGYGIQKGTIIFFNSYALNRSPQYWSEPNTFKPERFLMHVPILKARKAKLIRRLSRMMSGISFDSGIEMSCNENIDTHLVRGENCQVDVRPHKYIPQFMPFGTGKRTCLGQYMLRCYSFIIITHILQRYNVSVSDPKLINIKLGSLALPPEGIPIAFTPRE